jgi:hypothetical protein
MNLKRRLAVLEEVSAVSAPKRIQVIVSSIQEPWGEKTCERRLHDGLLTEIVHINGTQDEMSDEEIQRFIESQPIECSQQSKREAGYYPRSRRNKWRRSL